MIEKQTIRDFLISLVGKDVPFSDNDSLITSQMIDSLNVVRLIVFLQETYDIEFDSEELIPENLDSIQAITLFLERKCV
jgi:acyl carrier protein